MNSPNLMQSRMRISGLLVLVGLLIEGVSLHWGLPGAFLAFALIGFPIVLAGILLFLYSLVSVKASDID